MFSVQEAAARLRVSTSLVYALCDHRLLRHVRIGTGRGTIRIPEDAIDEYLSGRTVGAGGTTAPAPPLRHTTLTEP